MFKRANKITALVVAAASVMSVVPAMAATRLATKDGTIENAVAYKDGKYLYEGYRTDDDTKGIYFNSGDKDKKFDDVTDFSAYGKYGKSEVAVEDGSDKYLVDLATGKMTDDDTAEDLTTTAQAKLSTKLGKTDRYGNQSVNLATISKIENNRFGDVWYEYTASTGSAVTPSKTTTAGIATISYSGYTNQSGAYIDASHDVNVYAYNGTKMVKLEDLGDSNDGLTLKSITAIRTLGQDDKYIYRLVKVNITGALNVKTGASSEDLLYIQKIAKAQGEKEKDAYLPKSTESFLVSDQLNDDDAKDAAAEFTDAKLADTSQNLYYVNDGVVYHTFWKSDDKVKTVKMTLKNGLKAKTYKETATNGVSDKVDARCVVKSGGKDTKADAWSVDVNGNTWALYDGEIFESIKGAEFKSLYTVDRSFDRIDVYDENSLIAWNEDKEGYTTVTEGSKAAKDEAGTLVNPTPAKVGWDKLADGTWNFYDATGAKVVNNWANVGGVWYFLKADGVMATGWQQVGGTWYYLNASGAMQTGWANVGGTWYFLQSSGAMQTGWLNDNGTWYYLDQSGAMLANTTVGGYTLGASGAML